jgi:hypothetical protein
VPLGTGVFENGTRRGVIRSEIKMTPQKGAITGTES